MKKIAMLFAASAMMFMVACSGENSQKGTSGETAQDDQSEQQLTPAEANSIVGREYIENLQKSDSTVKVTPSGLGYKVITEGEGASPSATSNVKVVYAGKHINGSEFDNSLGNAIGFNLQQVIPGFTEGIMLMNKGAKYELYIPGEIAYGPYGRPDAGIAPNELLIFEIELVDFD